MQLTQLENCVNESRILLEGQESLLALEPQTSMLHEETREEQEETSAQLQERVLLNLNRFLAESASTNAPQREVRRHARDHFFTSQDERAASTDAPNAAATPTQGTSS